MIHFDFIPEIKPIGAAILPSAQMDSIAIDINGNGYSVVPQILNDFRTHCEALDDSIQYATLRSLKYNDNNIVGRGVAAYWDRLTGYHQTDWNPLFELPR